MNVLDYLSAAAEKQKANVFEMVLVQNGTWTKKTLIPVSPCQDCYSVTKNFTATAVGILADRGMLSLDDSIARYLEQEFPRQYDKKLPQITIRHLLMHTAGFGRGFLFEGDRFSCGEDWLKYTLSQPIVYEPGSHFLYNNAGYYLLSCIVHRITGMKMQEFLRRELFAPLGINDFAWSSCPMGEAQGGTGLYLSTEDLAKFGLLYLNQGVYQEKRILSEEWVAQATCAQITPDGYTCGYGYSFWTYPDSSDYRGDGAYQQIVLVLPGQNAVLALHAFTNEFQYYDIIKKALPD